MKHLLIITAISLLALKAQTQNVGIGTTTPQTKLHILSASDEALRLDADKPYLSLYSAGVYKGYFWKGPNSIELGSATGSNLPITFAPNGVPRMYIDYNGNVGIGINIPRTTLHIAQGSSGNNTPLSPLVVESNSNTFINLLSPNANETGVLFGKTADALSGGIVYNNPTNTNGFQFRTNGNATRMVLDQNGNLGIGNTDPVYRLDISNMMRIRSGGDNNTSAGLYLNNNANNLAAFIGMENDTLVGFYGTGTGWKFGMNTTTGDVKIMERLGIGTNTPLAKLHVSQGASGNITPFGPLVVEGNSSTYINLLSPNANETGVLFGNVNNAASGGIVYNNSETPNGFQFRTIGNFTKMVLNQYGDLSIYGYVGIGTSAPTASLEVYGDTKLNGYTKLGYGAPSIKMKKLTGTTAATEGGQVNIGHGLIASKILSISVMVSSSTDVWFGPNWGPIGFNFSCNVWTGYIQVVNVFGSSASILSKQIKILITYEE